MIQLDKDMAELVDEVVAKNDIVAAIKNFGKVIGKGYKGKGKQSDN